MEAFLIALLVLLLVAGAPAYLIAYFTHKKLAKSANKNAKLISIITFSVSLLLIMAGIATLILCNIRIER